ncbi:SDR family NAD(P)-dependent oxidoreductase [Brevibacillus fulvus]|uniref:Short-subunit dehydrogenase n=1 Tax=Brevibacillus fulvus TaxID=1125967 RepID=A0A939BVM0_9BACL|nr:SDR family NAD(P)-dependent oxidoreductase [Brevibacillus fulvus]MBM7590821.1 short-subunit dehydrogenase [Brevibacillus fulvus]
MKDWRIVIITGGTGGLGFALAAEYLRCGDLVILTGRNRQRLQQCKEQLANSPRLHVYPLDVTDYEAVTQFCQWVKTSFGRCDILINNAGTAVFKHFADMQRADIDRLTAANLNGLLYMTHAFLPMMLAANRGQLVNIGSLAGRVATAKAAVYAASKAAVIRFSEGLRQELANTGISVTCILPGPIDTPFLDKADSSGTYRHQVRHYLLKADATATKIRQAVDARKAEVALPFRLHFFSLIYLLLPQWLKRWTAPLFNRK